MNARIAVIALALPMTAFAAADPKVGQTLHDKQCVACHVRLMGADGSSIYTRPERLIKSMQALRQRVSMCATQIDAKWFPEDEENVATYLNQRYYKFK
jgi:mono/diheme cytochrome c family protein